MNGLIISWFFPPATSAEGLVTFKLLKNSSFHYDTLYACSNQWSYGQDSVLASPNIIPHPLEAPDFKKWIQSCRITGKELLNSDQYDFMMTRAMPPESHTVGLKLKKNNPDLFWIASMADPIGRNPYDYDRYFGGGLRSFLKNPVLFCARVFLYAKNIWFDRRIIKKANLIIFPSINQARYTLSEKYDLYKDKVLILPHTYDNDMFSALAETASESKKDDRIVLSHLGHLNAWRSAKGLIRGAALLKKRNPELAARLLIRLIGNIPASQRELIHDLDLDEIIIAEPSVNYFESLAIMRRSDMLLLIDAQFHFMKENIFFASKLADYMGAQKPVLGLTTESGPSGEIIRAAGCPVCPPDDAEAICVRLADIARSGVPEPDLTVYKNYDAKNAAEVFDKRITEELAKRS